MKGKFKLELAGRELQIELQDLAEMSNGNVLVRYGDTVILATTCMSKEDKEDLGFFPLTVDYEERYYAAGKIRGARYIRREGRPSDEAILVSRLIDRAIRPLFPESLKREVQVIITCLSWDGQNDPDVLGLIGASLALSLSDIPWEGPISALRIGKKDNNFLINPTYEEREKSDLDLVLSVVPSKEEFLINMVEGGMNEISEDVILAAFEFAKPYLKEIFEFQKKIIADFGKEKIKIEVEKNPDLEKEVKNFLGNNLEKAIYQKNKSERVDQLSKLKTDLANYIEEKYGDKNKKRYALDFFEKEIKRILREKIIKTGERPDGRKWDEIRELEIKVGILPRTHGSALFRRGQTRSLSILTLGAPGDQQLLEGMEIVGKKRFLHHYNFPPYSVGEIRALRGPGRREIGHGMLVEKALLPLIPSFEEFPYTMRIVSEILSSNGSTSMAAVSSSSLALMDAGVPLKRPVAGISIGLMSDNTGDYKVIADIQGPEDHHGDMDFKIAGTEQGITALQMDVKIRGINRKILEESLSLARKIRLQILERMAEVIEKPRANLSPFAPRILTLKINPEKIREVIGPGGKVINEIIAETQTNIDIEQNGLIFITSENKEAAEKALVWIKNITREVKVGEVFQGKIKRILDFGAFVEILPGQDGLIHISQLPPRKKIDKIFKIGDIVQVKVIKIDDQGRINLAPTKNNHFRI
jgi:polyribonucleotide nucleotidyltransferase